MKYLKYITLIIFIAFVASCSKDNEDDIIPPPEENTPSTLPQKELRGVWVTTAWGLDWPMEKYNADVQKKLSISSSSVTTPKYFFKPAFMSFCIA